MKGSVCMLLECSFYSSSLNNKTRVNIIIPDKCITSNEPCKTLWLLHGMCGDYSSWVTGSNIDRYATKHNLVVVMPDGNNCWYTNTAYGANYFDFISKELPELVRNTFKCVSDKREDNIIAGLSMGGYGALKHALSHPEKYCACISLSGSLDVTRKNRKTNIPMWKSIFGFDQTPDELENTGHDLFYLAKKCVQDKALIPEIYLWCGTEDSLIDINDKFHNHLTDLDISHTYQSSEGDHSWKWWDMHIENALDKII